MLEFVKKEAVFVISSICAIISMFFVPPNKDYISYIDYRVIALLYILISVVAGLSKSGIFNKISRFLISKVKNARIMVMVLWMLCFFMSMIITIDVALITFVPLAIIVLKMSENEKYIIYTIVLQTIAANLGSMLTPMGNPQNLYLYSYYNVDTLEFFKITMPVIVLSFVLLIAFSFYIKPDNIIVDIKEDNKKSGKLLYLYILLGILALLSVFKALDYKIVLITTIILELIFDREIFKRVDWFLLLTFVAFFIFVGNIGNINIIKNVITNLIKGKEVLVSALTSQVISNVPSAVMLSGFTNDYRGLILGTNIGGLGTLVASLASLISFKLYMQEENSNSKKYLAIFSLLNFVFIIILLTVFIFWFNI